MRPGGTIACLGMDHFMGKTPSVNWFDQFLRNISVTGGLVPGKRYFPELLALAERGEIDPAPMLSHRLDAGRGRRGLPADGGPRRGGREGGPAAADVSLGDRLAAVGQHRLAARPWPG